MSRTATRTLIAPSPCRWCSIEVTEENLKTPCYNDNGEFLRAYHVPLPVPFDPYNSDRPLYVSPKADPEVLKILWPYIGNRNVRLRLHYGNVETGEDWGDTFDVSGYLGRTFGPRPGIILCSNVTSIGGGLILESCIVRVRFANRANGGDLWRHPSYHVDREKLRDGFGGDEFEFAAWFSKNFA